MRRNKRTFRGGISGARMVLYLVMALLLAAVFVAGLGLRGLPRWAVRSLERRYSRDNLRFSVDAVYWHPAEGIIAQGLRLDFAEEIGRGSLLSEQVTLRLKPLAVLRGEEFLQGLRIDGGTAGFLPARSGAYPQLSLSNLQAAVRFTPEALRIDHFHGDLPGVTLAGSGSIRPKRLVRPAIAAELRFPDEDEIAAAREYWDKLYFREPLDAEVRFDLDTADWGNSELSLAARGGPVLFRDLSFDSCRLELHWRDGRISIPGLRLAAGAGLLEISGDYDVAAGQAAVRIECDLPPEMWFRAAPADWRRILERMDVKPGDRLRGVIEAGPVPPGELHRRATGWLAAEGGYLNGVWTPFWQASFRIFGTQVLIPEARVKAGRERRGSFSLSGVFDGVTGNFELRAAGQAYPDSFREGLRSSEKRILDQFVFEGPPVHGEAYVRGTLRGYQAPYIEGRFRGRDVRFRGELFEEVDGSFVYDQGKFEAQPLHVNRPEGSMAGMLRLDFRERVAELDAASRIDPHSSARIVGPVLTAVVGQFRFGTNTLAVLEGRVPFDPRAGMDFRGRLQADRIGWWRMRGEDILVELEGKGSRLTFDPVHAAGYGGKVVGSVTWTPVPQSIHWKAAATAEVSNIELSSLMEDLRPGAESERYAGHVDGSVRMAGNTGPGWQAALSGAGKATLEHTSLLQIPLFTPLGNILNRIIPGLRQLGRSTLETGFQIRDRRVCFDETVIEGPMLGMTADGTCDFDGRLDMSFHLRIKPRGPLSTVVDMLTFPITKTFMDFRLEGCLTDPQWRPITLPKEFYLRF